MLEWNFCTELPSMILSHVDAVKAEL